MSPSADQYRGALLGLALGGALGAPHEGGPLERFLWRALGSTRDGQRRFTDDTQMSLDLAESRFACGDVDQDDLAARFFDAPFDSLLRFAADGGGDVDTVCAVAGAIWGARNGLAGLPAAHLRSVEDADRIDDVARQVYARSLTVPAAATRSG